MPCGSGWPTRPDGPLGNCACKVASRRLPPMTRATRRSRLLAVLAAGGALALVVVAVPVLGQGTPGRDGLAVAPQASEKAKPAKGPKADKAPETPVTLTGLVGTRTDADGGTTYTLTVGTTVYDLEAGPPWFWKDNHPLTPFVGRTVTIEGDQAQGGTTVDVRTVDGTAIRDAGRPPWAGGWKAVGKDHPGWAQWKADKQTAKDAAGHGRPEWAGPKGPNGSDDPNEADD